MPGLADLAAFAPGGSLNVVVECPRGSRVKCRYEAASGGLRYVRPLPAGVAYPFDWGFIPGTLGEDGDPLDALVLHGAALPAGSVVGCRLLGVLEVRQSERGRTVRNDRFMVVPTVVAARDRIRSLRDLPGIRRAELEEFFRLAVAGTGKRLSFLRWQGAEPARRAIRRGVAAAAFLPMGMPPL